MTVVEMRIDVDDYFPIVDVVRHRSYSLPSQSFAVADERSRNSSFCYSKLPEEPLKLSVLKLDGSCFGIQVKKTASIAELRQAVEDAFSYMPKKGPGKISWSHVWSHFCLVYDGSKLLAETDYIRNYGIKDGDQLQFIRHISSSFSLRKKKSTKQIAASDQHEISQSPPDAYEEREQIGTENNSYDLENGACNSYDDKHNISEKNKTGLAAFVRVHHFLPSSRMLTMERSLKRYPSKSAFGILGSFRKVIQLCGDKYYSKRQKRREGLVQHH